MVTTATLTADAGRVSVTGDMTVATVRGLFNAAPAFTGAVSVDLKSVGDADSAGLALLLHWSHRARAAGGAVTLVNPPKQLKQLAAISGVKDLFGK